MGPLLRAATRHNTKLRFAIKGELTGTVLHLRLIFVLFHTVRLEKLYGHPLEISCSFGVCSICLFTIILCPKLRS